MGGQRAIVQLYNLIAEKHNVNIISVSDNEPADGFHFTIDEALGSSKLRYINPLLFFRIKKIMAKNNSNTLILVHPYYGWLGVMLKWLAGKKLVVQTQNIEGERFKTLGKPWWPILWQYEKFTHRQANENLFITDEDKCFGIEKFGLNPALCHTITYGFEMKERPSQTVLEAAKERLRREHKIAFTEKILLFNGSLDYQPNLNAINYILKEILPRLDKRRFSYKLIICGKGLPPAFNKFNEYPNIIYTGFVDDISHYFMGADIFINPVNEGGGIKTKLVEALGYNLSCVSTKNGAFGVPVSITNGKLIEVENTNWDGFVDAIINTDASKDINEDFYRHFYWEHIADKAAAILEK